MSNPVTPYQMTINNCVAFLKKENGILPFSRTDKTTSFQISEVLAIAFCTTKEQVMSDLLKAYRDA